MTTVVQSVTRQTTESIAVTLSVRFVPPQRARFVRRLPTETCTLNTVNPQPNGTNQQAGLSAWL